MKLQEQLRSAGACEEAREWAEDFTSAQKAWDACERGDWMLWAVGKSIYSDPWTDGRKPLLACALDCALTVKHLWPNKQKDKIGEAVKALRLWIKGKATTDQAVEARRQLDAACDADSAASAAAYDADSAASAAAYAAYAAASAAAYAAYAADAASDASAYASDASAYASYASDAASDASRAKTLAKCAKIVRKHFPKPPTTKGRK
jgi:hypothetical protein